LIRKQIIDTKAFQTKNHIRRVKTSTKDEIS
ncbi:hypothetical protein PVAND_017724, partial [Polypedilum vanderplanki]